MKGGKNVASWATVRLMHNGTNESQTHDNSVCRHGSNRVSDKYRTSDNPDNKLHKASIGIIGFFLKHIADMVIEFFIYIHSFKGNVSLSVSDTVIKKRIIQLNRIV